MRGKLISFEGGDGVGKSTQLTLLADGLTSAGKQVLCTREPGGTALAEQIRRWVLHDKGAIAPVTELLLIFAARCQHIIEVIEPNLASGKWVLCDRFTDASYAYQGGGRGIPVATIQQVEAVATAGLLPDLTLLLDMPVEYGEQRSVGRGEGSDRFEAQEKDFKIRIRAAYQARQQSDPGRVRLVNALESVDVVQAQVWSLVSALLGQEDE